MTANHDGGLSDAELDAVLSAAGDDLLAYIRSVANPDAALLAIMEAGDRTSVPAGATEPDDPVAAPAAAIAAGMRSVARAVELAVSIPGGAVRIGVSAGEEPQEGPSAPSAAPVHDRGLPVDVVADLIREINSSNEKVEELYLRARHATGTAARSAETARLAEAAARQAKAAHLAARAEYPHRRAPLALQVILMLGTVSLDGIACYFAAQALGGSQAATLAWTGLFLAALTAGQVILGFRDRRWRTRLALGVLLGALTAGLGVLRFSYLVSTGADSPAQAFIGACLLTAVTAGILYAGYRALQAAEKPPAWRARQRARMACRAAQAAQAAARADAAERDHLIDAYLRQARRLTPAACLASQQLATEAAIRARLDPTAERQTRKDTGTQPRPSVGLEHYLGRGTCPGGS